MKVIKRRKEGDVEILLGDLTPDHIIILKIFTRNGSPNRYYKLQRAILDSAENLAKYAFGQLDRSDRYIKGISSFNEQLAIEDGINQLLYAFNNLKDFSNWLAEELK